MDEKRTQVPRMRKARLRQPARGEKGLPNTVGADPHLPVSGMPRLPHHLTLRPRERVAMRSAEQTMSTASAGGGAAGPRARSTDETRVLAMRRSVTFPIDFDSLSDAEVEEWMQRVEERYTDPECGEAEGNRLLECLAAAREALTPDFGNTIHELNCLWVENYQRNMWERPGHKAHRAFTVIQAQDVPSSARRCQYCFGGRWSPGRPRVHDPRDLGSVVSVRAIPTALETNRRRH